VAASVGCFIGLAGCVQPGKLNPSSTTSASTSSAAGITDIATPIVARPGLKIAQLGTLKDLTSQELIGKFGKPDFLRREETAEIWQYRSSACVLELFLYPSASGNLQVAHVTTHYRASVGGPSDQCVPFGGDVTAAS
jgi:hypothetical protein